jgi:hypothetical protein
MKFAIQDKVIDPVPPPVTENLKAPVAPPPVTENLKAPVAPPPDSSPASPADTKELNIPGVTHPKAEPNLLLISFILIYAISFYIMVYQLDCEVIQSEKNMILGMLVLRLILAVIFGNHPNIFISIIKLILSLIAFVALCNYVYKISTSDSKCLEENSFKVLYIQIYFVASIFINVFLLIKVI